MAKAKKQDDLPAIADPVTERALARIREHHGDAVVAATTEGQHPFIQVRAEGLRDVARLLRDDPSTRMDCCHLVSGVDWPKAGELEAVYHLCSYALDADALAGVTGYTTREAERLDVKRDAWICLKVRVPRDKPEVPTVMDLWVGADWHERETFDLVGIRFTGRKDLQRILLPEDWPGHPLQKDWAFPAAYHGVPIVPPEGL